MEDLVWWLVFLYVPVKEVVGLRLLSKAFRDRVERWNHWIRQCSNVGRRVGTPFERFVAECKAPAPTSADELKAFGGEKVVLKEVFTSHARPQLALPGAGGLLKTPRRLDCGYKCHHCGIEDGVVFIVYYDAATTIRDFAARETIGLEWKCSQCGYFTQQLVMRQFVTGLYGPCGGAMTHAINQLKQMKALQINWVRDALEDEAAEKLVKSLPPTDEGL